MLIRNYGLFWRRDQILWGKKGSAGHLKGYLHYNKSIEPVDFREQQGIYVLYVSSFKLIYVGQAGENDQHDLFKRLRDHRGDHLAARWSLFSWFGIRSVLPVSNRLAKKADGSYTTNAAVLNHLEAVLIATAEPPLNLQGGRFGNARQYLQWRDPALGADLNRIAQVLMQKQTSS